MLDQLKQFYTDCASAIREKRETTDKIKPSEMANEIRKIISKAPVASGEYHHIVDTSSSKPQVKGNTLFGTLLAKRHSQDSYIEEIVLMSDVTAIPQYFAESTSNLYTLEIQGLIDSIDQYAFKGSGVQSWVCEGIVNKYPSRATVVPNYCFQNARGLANGGGIVLHDNITEIGTSAFDIGSGGAGTTVHIDAKGLPGMLSKIGDKAFYYQQFELSRIPAGVQTIGSNAFAYNMKLKSLKFGGKPTSIASNAFAGCTNLTEIDVPWSEGAVANAPWGATNATITYH